MEKTEPSLVPQWLKTGGGSGGTTTNPSHSDDRGLSRNNSFVNKNDVNRTTSSYFRRSSSSIGSNNLRNSNSFNRNNDRDRDWFKDESSLGAHWHRGRSDPSLTRVSKEGLRHSRSMVYEGRVETTWARKDKVAEKSNVSEVKRVPSPSPGLSSAMVGVSGGGGDKWKSALAEVPGLVEKSGSSLSLSKHGGLNMAETLAQGPSRGSVTPQVMTEAQRLEELAIKQSRQLIPVTPSMPKVLSTSDKLKSKIGQPSSVMMSSINTVAQSPRGGPVKPDLSRATSVGKQLHVLKPTWEKKDGVSSVLVKDNSSSVNGVKVVNSSTTPLVTTVKSIEQNKLGLPLLEKRPLSQAQSRNDFFNLMRKKSVGKSSSSTLLPSGGGESPPPTEAVLPPSSPVVATEERESESLDITCNGKEKNGKTSFGSIFVSEEAEAAFLRKLGWDENGEEGGLTEEEIRAFHMSVNKYNNAKPAWKILQGSIAGISFGLNSSSNSKLES